MAVKLDYVEVSRTHSSRPSPYHYGAPAGTDYFTVIVYRAVWPLDGTCYAGKSYDRRETWIGPEEGMRHVLINSESYPTGYFDKK
jgi:hypothetical protein